jgi:hypothetical protein
MTTLGTGSNEAVIYERGGTHRLFTVPAETLEWGRTLDAVSRAVVTATPKAAGGSWRDCCGLLATVHPWAHEVVMWRDGERVWEGPVRRVAQTRSGVTILASDVLGWTERAPTSARTVLGSPVIDEAVATLTAAYAYTGDPNVLANIMALGDDALVTDLETKAGAGYYSAVLDTLAKAGLYFTTVGRRPLLWADPTYVLGRTAILNPARHLMGDVEIAREGDELATDAWGVNDEGVIGTDGGTDDFYGRVGRIVSMPGITTPTALAAAAAEWRRTRYPAPNSLTIPAGPTLHCDAPFAMAELVPGVLTPVKATDLCWPVEQTMMLTAVKVTQDAGGERVGVTYQPITGDEAFGEG